MCDTCHEQFEIGERAKFVHRMMDGVSGPSPLPARVGLVRRLAMRLGGTDPNRDRDSLIETRQALIAVLGNLAPLLLRKKEP